MPKTRNQEFELIFLSMCTFTLKVLYFVKYIQAVKSFWIFAVQKRK